VKHWMHFSNLEQYLKTNITHCFKNIFPNNNNNKI
jgi:hypothetical protein